MLVLNVGFPTGRCYAARSDAPDLPEWPPHPSRLYSALVSAACSGREAPTEEASRALIWLEQQAPPVIDSPPADQTSVPTSYVPPGDLNQQRGKDEHPFARIRKPRNFPGAFILGTPSVRYGWEANPPDEVLAALDELARETTHLGTSHSMVVVSARVGQLDKRAYVPDAEGSVYMRVPVAGRLNELREIFDRASPRVRRPPSAYEPLVTYAANEGLPPIAESPFRDLMVLRLRGITHGIESVRMLARSMRRAVMSRLSDPIPAAVHGHEDGLHVAWLPLADVGHRHAQGRVMAIAVAAPKCMEFADYQRLLRALGEVCQRGLKLDDGRLTEIEPPAVDTPLPLTLRARTWVGPSREWATVTPVVPDRLPRRLREHYLRRSVVDSLARVGLPEPEDLVVGRLSPIPGVPPATSYPGRLSRFHVHVRFPTEVTGPIAAGRERYFGGGLFRPWRR